jgi:RecB family exonuclease
VRLQGSIDRIDLVETADGVVRFRVIDYKTGPTPAAGELQSGLALQLPLYALAAERMGLAGPAESADFGYWALKDKGFRPTKLAKTDDWQSYAGRLERFVLALADHLRRAEFPVAPRSEHCMKHCEYTNACRIRQVRAIGKVWVESPAMEPAP